MGSVWCGRTGRGGRRLDCWAAEGGRNSFAGYIAAQIQKTARIPGACMVRAGAARPEAPVVPQVFRDVQQQEDGPSRLVRSHLSVCA